MRHAGDGTKLVRTASPQQNRSEAKAYRSDFDHGGGGGDDRAAAVVGGGAKRKQPIVKVVKQADAGVKFQRSPDSDEGKPKEPPIQTDYETKVTELNNSSEVEDWLLTPSNERLKKKKPVIGDLPPKQADPTEEKSDEHKVSGNDDNAATLSQPSDVPVEQTNAVIVI
jgi:hypothetical protein